ncbi:hypothetical protein ACFFHU_17495, partial [Plantactinospora siamensis]
RDRFAGPASGGDRDRFAGPASGGDRDRFAGPASGGDRDRFAGSAPGGDRFAGSESPAGFAGFDARGGLAAESRDAAGMAGAESPGDLAGFGGAESGGVAAGSDAPGGAIPAGPSPAVPAADVPRRRRSGVPHRGRAVVGGPTESAETETPPPGSALAGTSFAAGHQLTTTESAPSRPLNPDGPPGPRVIIDHVQVSTFGLEASVEVSLSAAGQRASGVTTGPAVDGYVLRLCAASAASAIGELLRTPDGTAERGRCFVEHAAVLPFGNCEVATVVVFLVCEGWVEQLAGSALVSGDPRQAVVRATLAAVNRRLEALLA